MSKHRRPASDRRLRATRGAGTVLVGSALGAVTLLPATMFAGTATAAELPQVCQDLEEAQAKFDDASAAYEATKPVVAKKKAELAELEAADEPDEAAIETARAELGDLLDEQGRKASASLAANTSRDTAAEAAKGANCNEVEDPPKTGEGPKTGETDDHPAEPAKSEECDEHCEEECEDHEVEGIRNEHETETTEVVDIVDEPVDEVAGVSVTPADEVLGVQVSDVPVGSVDAGDGSTEGSDHIGLALAGLGALGLTGTGAGAIAYRRRLSA